jgi:hypothetical protein
MQKRPTFTGGFFILRVCTLTRSLINQLSKSKRIPAFDSPYRRMRRCSFAIRCRSTAVTIDYRKDIRSSRLTN